jgi:hypothetical protein
MHSLSRRDAFTSALLAAVAPSEVLAEHDPHLAWLEEWRALRDVNRADLEDGIEDDDVRAKMRRIAIKIRHTPAVSGEGLVAKLEFFQESNFHFSDCYVDPDEANEIVGEIIAFLGKH